MRGIIRAWAVLAGIFFVACTEEDSKPFRAGTQPKFNIEDASGLVVFDGSSVSGGRVATEEVNLYKITQDGQIEKVKVLYDDNTDPNSALQVNVQRFYRINDDYFALTGGFHFWDTLGNDHWYNSLLVRKTDGAIFSLNYHDTSIYSSGFGLDDETFQSDNTGNFYYLNNEEKVVWVDVSDPSNLTMRDYLPTGQTTFNYAIDNQGNCMYRSRSFDGFRLRKNNGGIHEIMTDDTFGYTYMWVGANHSIYYSTSSSIYRVAVNASHELDLREVWSKPLDVYGIGRYENQSYFKIQKQNSIIFLGTEGKKHWEFFEGSNEVVEMQLPELARTAKIVYSDEYYYIASGTSLYKVSLGNNTYQTILSPGQYEVYVMSVNNDEVLQISAMRFSDGKKIVAEIDAQNKLTVLDEEQDRPATIMQRLN